MDLFWTKGYEATGVTELLTTMGIGRQSMYDTFGNKRDLFLEALRVYGQQRVTEAVATLQGPGSPLGNIMRALDMAERMLGEHGAEGCLMGNTIAELGGRDGEVADVARHGMGLIRGAIHDALQRAREAGEVSLEADIEALADLVITTVQGSLLLSKVNEDLTMSRSALRGLRSALKTC